MAEQMKGQFNIPASPACGQWETLLVDAMDGLLRPEEEAVFSSHMASCAACTEMFEQVRRGREWLEFLSPEPEVPAYLLDKILVETGHGKAEPRNYAVGKLAIAGGPDAVGNIVAMPPVWQRPGFAGRMRRFAEPRLLMTAAMAFFSIALTLSMTGVRITGIKIADLRPTVVRSALEKRIMTASTPLVRYYDHLRFVYEVESTMREMRRNSESDADQNRKKSQPAGTSGTGGEGETRKKYGGSQQNPNAAPQQTVNPPVSLWGGDNMEARMESRGLLPEKSQPRKGSPTRTEASGSLENTYLDTGSLTTSVLAMPERSSVCIA